MASTGSATERETLAAALESALLHELREEWARVNAASFKRGLRPPVLALTDATSVLGRFDRNTRTLEIQRTFAIEKPWGAVVEVLKHEMAHQFVFEVLGVEDETSHGPAFVSVCERLGIDARARGTPETGPDEVEQRALERIAKLLALASSDSEHEAESAMKAAQRLMLKYNLDARSSASTRGYAFLHLGKASGRITEAERMIAVILGEHFFVEVIWVPVYRVAEGKRGSVLEICGTPTNLEMASYVYDFLLRAGERLWVDHRKRENIRSNRDRRTYLAGVMSGFFQKLNEEKRRNVAAGLIWVGDADLRTFYRKRHPHIVHARFAGHARNEAHAKGRAAGKQLVLRRPMGSGPAAGSGRGLLGPGSR